MLAGVTYACLRLLPALHSLYTVVSSLQVLAAKAVKAHAAKPAAKKNDDIGADILQVACVACVAYLCCSVCEYFSAQVRVFLNLTTKYLAGR
jgi:hypothetical protein